MKELSIEEKAKAYDGNYKTYTELINRLEDVKNAIKKQNYGIAMDILCKPYPVYQITTSTELKESENIRKRIIDALHGDVLEISEIKEAIDWLKTQGKHSNFLSKIQIGDKVTRNEDGVLVNLSQLKRVAKKDDKQGEQNPVDNGDSNLLTVERAKEISPFMRSGFENKDKVEPKFKAGDWIVTDFNNVVKINAITGSIYVLENRMVFSVDYVDKYWRKWTIKEAKDGDVLADGNLPFIFKKIDSMMHSYAYCGISVDSGFKIESEGEFGEWTWAQDIKPATKEQRDQLEKAMADAGYTFDFERKELKKIEQKSATWSEEDEGFLKLLLAIFTNEHPNGIFSTDNITVFKGNCVTSDRIIDWLKSLKDRVSCEANCTTTKEWSDEDSIRLQRIIDFLWYNRKGDTDTIYQQEQDIDWLKSIKSELKHKQEEVVLRWESGHPEPYKSVLILRHGNGVVEGEWNEETGRWYQYGFQSYLEDNEVDGWMNKKSLLSSFNFQHHWKPSDLPHWKKSALPDDDTTGFNSVNFCYNGYYINYRELFNKLPKDD